MALVIEREESVYDLSRIAPGCLLYGRHRTWPEGRAGIVTAARDKILIVQFRPEIGNVTNHLLIPVEEVLGGEWEIRWSPDLSEVYSWPEPDGGEETG